MRLKKLQKGLTFIELLVVIGVISTGVVASVAMITSAFTSTMPLADKLTASYLTQEGVESVRRVRDSGWLQGKGWEDIVDEMEGTGRIDYNSEEIEGGLGANFFRLYVDGDGLFSHDDAGDYSGFRREVNVERVETAEEDYLLVTVTVFWEERGEEERREAYLKLYRWYD